MTFQVQRRRCATCIYRADTHFDLAALLDEIRDPKMDGFFAGWRVCHHSRAVCCRGFWDHHRDDFAAGQIAQRLGLVAFVSEDRLK